LYETTSVNFASSDQSGNEKDFGNKIVEVLYKKWDEFKKSLPSKINKIMENINKALFAILWLKD
jgi:hypothetical protein